MIDTSTPAGYNHPNDTERSPDVVMLNLGRVEAILNNNPARDGTDYRNAWNTVSARLRQTKRGDKRERLVALHARMEALGAPLTAETPTREETLLKAQAANQARVVARSKALIMGRIESSMWRNTSVSDRKPWLFEAALQMVEDGAVSVISATANPSERGPLPAGGVRPVWRTLVLGPPDPEFSRPCGWMSARRQAEQEGRI